MAGSQPVEWDLDEADIATIDSDTLYENRPNRWRGPASTWKGFNEYDRYGAQALDLIRSQDLSIHLYNIFVLKRDGLPRKLSDQSSKADSDGEEEAQGRRDVWRPSKTWTAWPLRAGIVPNGGLMPDVHDNLDYLTSHWTGPVAPGSDLEEAITGAVLKAASQRFAKRSFEQETVHESIEDPAAVEVSDENSESVGPSRRNVGPMSSPESRGFKMELDPRSSTLHMRSTLGPAEQLESSMAPVVSADDAFSHALPRPAVRSIMSKLDKTLATLHHARNAGVKYESDSATSGWESGEASATASRARTPQRRRKQGQSKDISSDNNNNESQEIRHRQRASKGKRKATGSSSNDDGHSEAEISDVSMKEEFENSSASGHSVYDQHASARSSAKRRRQKPDPAKQQFERERKLRKLGLRDWSEVIGAATLAGFPPQVIARAAQRCSNLFGQSMTFQTISEGPRHIDSVKSRTVNPGHEPEPLSSGEEIREVDTKMKRSISRYRSQSRLNRASQPRSVRASSAASTSSRRRRSSSVASTSGMWYCTFPDCRAALRGFTRRDNLIRHLRNAHGVDARGGDILQASRKALKRVTSTDEDDEDEEDLVDGLHIDGFLQPINPRRGWRGADKVQRSRSRKRRAASSSSA